MLFFYKIRELFYCFTMHTKRKCLDDDPSLVNLNHYAAYI